MSKGSFALVLVLALACGYLGVRLHAATRPVKMPMPMSHPLVRLVGMTPKQTRQLAALEKQFVACRDPLRDKVLARRADIYRQLQADHPNEVKIDADIKAISALQTQVQREVAKHLLRVKSILNAAQRKQFFAALAVTMCPAALGPMPASCPLQQTRGTMQPARGPQGSPLTREQNEAIDGVLPRQ